MLVLVGAMLSCAGGSGYSIDAGIVTLCMRGEQAELRMRERTTTVPVGLPAWDALGFQVRSSGSEPFTVSQRHYLPGVPEERPAGAPEPGQPSEPAAAGFELPEETVSSGRWFVYRLEPDDPIGLYRIEIFIDGRKHETLEFQVVPGKAAEVPEELMPPECADAPS